MGTPLLAGPGAIVASMLFVPRILALVFGPVHPWCALPGLRRAVLRMGAPLTGQVPKVPDLVAHLMEPFGQG